MRLDLPTGQQCTEQGVVCRKKNEQKIKKVSEGALLDPRDMLP